MATQNAPAGPLVSVPRRAGSPAERGADAPFTLTRDDVLRSLALIAAAALLAVVATVALLRLHPGVYYVDVGNFRDKYFLDGAHRQETAEDGTYRWTEAESTLSLTQIGVARHATLVLDLGGRPAPAPVELRYNGQAWTSFTADTVPRHYQLLLPPNTPETLSFEMRTETFQAEGDPRQLGVKVDGFGVDYLRDAQPLPLAPHVAAQVATLALLQATALRVGWRWRWQGLLLGTAALALAAVLVGELLLAHAYMPRLAGAALVLALLTWVGLPLAERAARREEAQALPLSTWGGVGEARLLWAMMLFAIGLRLVAVLYPTFGGQDLGRNIYRFVLTITGQLIIIAPSGEFARGLTIYPPGPYLGLAPLGTLTQDLGTILQGGLATMDGFTALLVALVARRLGASRDVSRMALVLYAGNIAAFGGMTYQFSAQIYGQWFTAPVLLLLLLAAPNLPGPRTWVLAYLLVSFQLFSHIGVMFLSVAWMGLTLAVLTLAWRRIDWWGWVGYALTCATAFVFLYIFIIDETLGHASQEILPGEPGVLFPGYRILLINGLRLAYTDLGLVLMPIGFWLIWRAHRRAYGAPLRTLAPAAGMLLAIFFYVMVDLLLNVQVRYFYFSLPLTLSAIAMALGPLAERGRIGRLAAWGLTVGMIAPYVALWFSATLGEGKVPMTPLTH